MKGISRTAAAVGLLLGATTLGQAADLPAQTYRAPAAVVAQAFNWTGGYVGLMGGYGFGTGDIDNFKGGVVGGTLGFNYQAPGSPLVAGFELDGGWTNFGYDNSVTIGSYLISAESRADAMATVRARLGYAWDRTLLYITGGGAWIHNKITGAVTGPGVAVSVSDTQSHTGWLVGAGIEQAFGANWSGKIEYNYIGLPSKTYFSQYGGYNTGDLNMHLIKFGLNYHF